MSDNAPVFERSKRPLVTRADIPAVRPDLADPTSVFNPGAVRLEGRDLLMLRVQTRARWRARVDETRAGYFGRLSGPMARASRSEVRDSNHTCIFGKRDSLTAAALELVQPQRAAAPAKRVDGLRRTDVAL